MIVVAFLAMFSCLVLGIVFIAVRFERVGLLRAASQIGGRVEGSGLFELPQIRLWIRNFDAVVQFSGSGNVGLTHLRIPWTDSELKCELRRRPVVDSVMSFLEQERSIDLAAPLMDSGYVVTGNDESRIRGLFSARVQTALINLVALPVSNSMERPDVQFSIADGLCTVTKSGRVIDCHSLVAFVRLCAELHEAALASSGTGEMVAAGLKVDKSCA